MVFSEDLNSGYNQYNTAAILLNLQCCWTYRILVINRRQIAWFQASATK